MIDIYINPLTGDMELKGSSIRTTPESDEVAQRISIRLQWLYQEWIFNTNLGVPYTQIIFENGVSDLDYTYAIIRKIILDTLGVVSIESLDISIDRDSREMTIVLEVNNGILVEVTT